MGKRRKHLVYVGVLFLWACLLVGARAPRSKGELVLEPTGGSAGSGRQRLKKKKGRVFAVVIGLGRYRDRRIQLLRYAKKDARDIGRQLRRMGIRQVKLLLGKEATAEKVKRALVTWLRRRATRRSDSVVVFFSGHSVKKGGERYWLLYNTRLNEPEVNGLTASFLHKMLDRLHVRKQLIFLDTCFALSRVARRWVALSRPKSKSSTFLPGEHYRGMTGQGRVVFTSSDGSQESLEPRGLGNGLFTYYLLKGLRGKADRSPKDGLLTVAELCGYLNQKVRAYAARRNHLQHPKCPRRAEGGQMLLACYGKACRGGAVRRSRREGTLTIRSHPPGATVEIDGAYAGKTTTQGLRKRVPAGRLKVVVSRAGYHKWSRRVLLSSGETMPLTIRLKRKAPPPRERPLARRREEVRRVPPPPRRRQKRRRRAGTVRSVRGVTGMKEVYIPAGTFTMGSPKSEPKRDNDERQRRVKLSRGFWMLQTEVTQGQFKALLKYNPSTFSSCGDRCPVEQVSWYEALAYANALSKKGGKEECYSCSGSGKGVKCSVRSKYKGKRYYKCSGYRLPTEAEWEYAARAGTSGARYGELNKIAYYRGNSNKTTHEVGKKQANSWGLYDMAGNVWEWCWDWYGKYTGSRVVDPVGASTGSLRVHRGGGWSTSARWTRAASRLRGEPGGRISTLGFRLVRADPR